VIVPPVWAGDQNDTAFAAADKYPGRFAIMGRFDPFAPGADARLAHWLDQPHMLGMRMSGRWGSRPQAVLDLIEDGSLDPFFATCERQGIPLMVLTMDRVSLLDRVAGKHPGLTLLVDHMSGVGPDTPQLLDALVALARYPKVCVKVGGGPNRSQEGYPFADMHSTLRRIYDSFGPRRLLWEADITQLHKNTYAECLRLWQEGLPFLSAEDKEWILGRTAAEVLNWPES
jgi:predicted TIM-barrel fold metal-dependent hydrolase